MGIFFDQDILHARRREVGVQLRRVDDCDVMYREEGRRGGGGRKEESEQMAQRPEGKASSHHGFTGMEGTRARSGILLLRESRLNYVRTYMYVLTLFAILRQDGVTVVLQ